ncbi:MAG: hypothetical protein IJ601_00080 [Acidaminococcaceae bacterium]|nr:hypothetical protein [Acidaminococcaceae bacterium]
MKKQVVASVLLASMAVMFPVYADGDLTLDEYNSEEKYESPLDQAPARIVNDYRNPKAEEGDAFAQAAGQFTQGAASGRGVPARQNNGGAIREASLQQDSHNVKSSQDSEKNQEVAEKRTEVKKAEEKAEQVLLETDEAFEPALEKEKPGSEYHARQMSLMNLNDKDFDNVVTTNKLNRAKNNTGKNNRTKKTENVPLIITGDDAQYASESGDFIVEGKVVVKQGLTRLSSTKAVGNAKTGDIWLLEGGTLTEPTNKVNAHWAHYNFNQETGELLHIKGTSTAAPGSGKRDYYEAPHGLIEHGMLIMDQGGTTTRCPAVRHSNCVSVKAKTITIIPNDRIIARGVQVFVKGKHIYSRDVWINDLTKKKDSTMPSIGWDDEKGWYVSLEYQQPIGNPLLKNPTTAYMHQVYYTKSKYKPFYGITHDEHDFYVRLHNGYVYDSDNDDIDEGIWLKKQMDWGLFLKPHRFAKGIPLSYEASLMHGLWQYSNRDWNSWHTEAKTLVRHDRIYPLGGKKLYLDLMIGRKWVHESNKERTRRNGRTLNSNNTNIYHGSLGYRFSNKWNIWTTYHHEHKTDYLFSLGQPSFTKDWSYGIAWSPDKHNTFRIVNRHNLDKDDRDKNGVYTGHRTQGLYTTTYSWIHRFCCEVLSVSYQKRHYNGEQKWTVKFEFLNW